MASFNRLLPGSAQIFQHVLDIDLPHHTARVGLKTQLGIDMVSSTGVAGSSGRRSLRNSHYLIRL
jgi:hypothetical protein